MRDRLLEEARDAWFVARKDVSFLLRQRETLLWVFLMPVVFFYFLGTVTRGASPVSDDRPDPLVLRAPPDAGFLAEEVSERLEREGFAVRRESVRAAPGGRGASSDSAGAARRGPSATVEDPSDGEAPPRVLVVSSAPDSVGRPLTAAALAGVQQELVFRRAGDGLTADYDRFRVARGVYGVVADLAVAASRGVEPTPAFFDGLSSVRRPVELRVETAGRREMAPSGFQQAVPGTMVMFTMLVLLTSGAVLLVLEREKGLLRRLAATPIRRRSVVIGKWTGKMALGVVQLGFAVAAGTWLFGVEWGDAPASVAAVLVGWAAFNASLGLLLGNAARTEAQTTGVGVLASLVLAALGGCWWPIEVTPAWMQTVALALPTGWTMDALHNLMSFGYGPASVLPHLAALAAGTLAVGWASVRTFRYH